MPPTIPATRTAFANLPADAHLHILSFLYGEDILSLRKVCKKVADLVGLRSVWKYALMNALHIQRIPIQAYHDILDRAPTATLMQMACVPGQLKKKFRASQKLVPKQPRIQVSLCPDEHRITAYAVTPEERYLVTHSESRSGLATRGQLAIWDSGFYCGRRPEQVFSTPFCAGVERIRTSVSADGSCVYLFVEASGATIHPGVYAIHVGCFFYKTRVYKRIFKRHLDTRPILTRSFNSTYVVAIPRQDAVVMCIWDSSRKLSGRLSVSPELSPSEIYLFPQNIMLVGPFGYAIFGLPVLTPMADSRVVLTAQHPHNLVEPLVWLKKPLCTPGGSIGQGGVPQARGSIFFQQSFIPDPSHSPLLACASKDHVQIITLKQVKDPHLGLGFLPTTLTRFGSPIGVDMVSHYAIPWEDGLIGCAHPPYRIFMVEKDPSRGGYSNYHIGIQSVDLSYGTVPWSHFSPIHGILFEPRNSSWLTVSHFFDQLDPFQEI